MEHRESQPHLGWNRPLEVFLSHALLKQAHVEPVAQDHVQLSFDYLQGWRLHNFSGQSVLVSSHPHISRCSERPS